MNKRHRANLLKLADYLESLPKDYGHFDMQTYSRHDGDCNLPMPPGAYAAKKPEEFLHNCGTVACAVGHGPAAGIKPRPEEFDFNAEYSYSGFNWGAYHHRVFGTSDYDWPRHMGPFDFLFGTLWRHYDNHPYGAAARIRYFLATGQFDYGPNREAPPRYAPYRKGSRSKIRREIDAQKVAA